MKKAILILFAAILGASFLPFPSPAADDKTSSAKSNTQGETMERVEGFFVMPTGRVQYAAVRENRRLVNALYRPSSAAGGNLRLTSQPMTGLPPAKQPQAGPSQNKARNSSVESLLGETVVNRQDHKIGRVYDLIVNAHGTIEYVVVDSRDYLTPVPYKFFSRNAEGDLVVNAAPSALAGAPKYRKPAYAVDPNLKRQWFGYWR